MRSNEFLYKSNNVLAKLAQQDQSERRRYQDFVKTKINNNWELGAKLYAKSHNRQSDDIFDDRKRLNQFLKMKFDFSTFSKEDWHNYWLLAQHLDWDRAFQKQALNNILKYLGKESEEYKYLYDRIQCGTSGTQTFGTQDICDKD